MTADLSESDLARGTRVLSASRNIAAIQNLGFIPRAFTRLTGTKEVIPGQKSASRKSQVTPSKPFVANTVADECKEVAARALQLNVQCLVPPFHRDVIGDGRSTIP